MIFFHAANVDFFGNRVKSLVTKLSQCEITASECGLLREAIACALPFARGQTVTGIIVIGFIIRGRLRRTADGTDGSDHYTGPALLTAGSTGFDDPSALGLGAAVSVGKLPQSDFPISAAIKLRCRGVPRAVICALVSLIRATGRASGNCRKSQGCEGGKRRAASAP